MYKEFISFKNSTEFTTKDNTNATATASYLYSSLSGGGGNGGGGATGGGDNSGTNGGGKTK